MTPAVHYVEFDRDGQGWTITHPTACRDALQGCPIHTWTTHTISGPPPSGPGRYRIVEVHDGYELEPA